MKPIALAVALALTAAPLLSAPPALAAPAAKAATPASPAWVARSNALAQILLDAQGPFQPEETGFFGVPGYDDEKAKDRRYPVVDEERGIVLAIQNSPAGM